MVDAARRVVLWALALVLAGLAWRGLWTPDPDDGEDEEPASWHVERA